MKSLKIEIRWAILFSLMMLSWMLMEKLAGFHDKNIEYHPVVSNFIAIPAITIFIFALRDKRKNSYGGKMTYKQGFISGFFISLFVTILTPLIQYITSTLITPDYFKNVSAYAISNKIITAEEAASMFNLGSYIIQATIGALVMGILTSAIVAAFMRKSE